MTVIAMTREMGTRGRDVALGVAEELGLDPLQHELVGHAADKMQVRESSVNRFLEGTAGLLERWNIDENDLSLYTTEEILEVAERGNVLFRGWGASYVLRPVPHVMTVRVCASEARRADEIMARLGIDDPAAARREIKRNDAAHARMMSHLFHVDWTEATLYDLVLNTDRLDITTCIETVVSMARRPEFQESERSRTRLRDMKVESHIRTALRENPKTNLSTPSFEAALEPGTGRVTLSGIAYDQEFCDAAESAIAAVDGVEEVDNQLTVIRSISMGP